MPAPIHTTCADCAKPIIVAAYRIKKQGRACCSCACGRALYFKENPSRFRKPKDIQAQARHMYERTVKTCDVIASSLGISRNTLKNWANAERWVREKVIRGDRTLYRNAAVKKIGRPLAKGEHVHHLDGDCKNNDLNNLHVFPDAKRHKLAHASMERCGFELFRLGVITFNAKTEMYELAVI